MKKKLFWKLDLERILLALSMHPNLISMFGRLLLVVFVIQLCASSCEKQTDVSVLHTVDLCSLCDVPFSFSWDIQSPTKNEQKAYQIVVYSEPENMSKAIFDSGKVESAQQLHIPYSGDSLNGGLKYYSKVRIWDKNNLVSDWSKEMEIIAPLNHSKDWKAKWITYNYAKDSALPLFRKEFQLDIEKEIDFARLYVAAPGFFEAYLNGEKIGDHVLDPAQTNYEDYTFYTGLNIAKERLGELNVLGIMLGNGWYNQNVVWNDSMIYGQPVFSAEIEVYFKDGSKKIIISDNSWKWKPGPITFSNIYAGEFYDARKEAGDWFAYTANTSWENALIGKEHPTKLIEQFAEPIKVMDSIYPKAIISQPDGTYIFDFGQNFTGWNRLKIDGEQGQEITIRMAEELSEDGRMDFRSTGVSATKVIQTEKYICKGGDSLEIWEPRFTYHGFRYAEVGGLDKTPTKDLLTGMVIYSAMENTGKLNTSESNVNKLHELTVHTLRGNLQGIPTDCPHREKCGWTGDAHAMAKTLMYNYNAKKFLTKYLFDMRSSGREEKKELYFGTNFHDRSMVTKPKGITTMIAPGRRTSGTASPDWGTAVVQIPWYLYVHYGDDSVLKEFYNDMKTWVDFVHSKKEDGVIVHGLGDWCPPGGNVNIDCPVPISSTAFHILDVDILSKTAKTLGFSSDEIKYTQMKNELSEAFNNAFLDKGTLSYGSQTANCLALDIGIVPKSYRKDVAASIVLDSHENFNDFINTGIFGIARIFKVLSENGFEKEAYDLLVKKGNNSFEAMWNHYNATTLWEVLPTTIGEAGSDIFETMAKKSHSHPMQGGFDAWFFSGIGGINPTIEDPGFKSIVFKPYLTQYIENSDISYKSASGTIKSRWTHQKDAFIWNVTIPNNCNGSIYVPNYDKAVSITNNGKPVDHIKNENGFSYIGDFGSGTYTIVVKNRV
ncbi:hypothetical protein DZC72_03195 [Maribacter algicola]|uniref:alpha-L-rhamnosidase n=1 Tax=Maribacter algicola TaxID=2498892 RepID=A0A426RKQ6_9FLAO|nr:alpha-L-rhamnosidase [Maribacter algicola]RRQ49617.1 hypothetical protein DZC72_03195 [Maribacter algicola]